MFRARRMRVDNTISECAPDASSQPTPPSGNNDRSTVIEFPRGELRSAPSAQRSARSFHYPNSIAQIGRELELLAVDCSAKSVFELAQHRGALERLRHRRPVQIGRASY